MWIWNIGKFSSFIKDDGWIGTLTDGSECGPGRPINNTLYLRIQRIRIRSIAEFPSHTYIFLVALFWCICAWDFLLCGQVGSVLVLRDPAVLVTLKMEYVNITLNNILSIYRSEHY
jgi:hypothetical protein